MCVCVCVCVCVCKVAYEITVQEIRRPGTLAFYVSELGLPGFISVVLVVGVLVSVYRTFAARARRGTKKKRS